MTLSSEYLEPFQLCQVIPDSFEVLPYRYSPFGLAVSQALYHQPPFLLFAQFAWLWSLSRSLVLKYIPTWYLSESPSNRQQANASLFYKLHKYHNILLKCVKENDIIRIESIRRQFTKHLPRMTNRTYREPFLATGLHSLVLKLLCNKLYTDDDGNMITYIGFLHR